MRSESHLDENELSIGRDLWTPTFKIQANTHGNAMQGTSVANCLDSLWRKRTAWAIHHGLTVAPAAGRWLSVSMLVSINII